MSKIPCLSGPLTPKRWEIAAPAPRSHLEHLSHLNPIVAQVLCNRGITDPEAADAFLYPRPRLDDPFRMAGVGLAVERIRAAIRAEELVVVYGDFDADGVTATVLMVETLKALGARVSPYIPHRVDEGYGLNRDALDKIARDGSRLVITVDCGIRSPDEVAHGNRLGLDMIVTDHHSIARDGLGREQLPPALAVINPRREDDAYPFSDFAGVGIAFKLAQALMLRERSESRRLLAHPSPHGAAGAGGERGRSGAEDPVASGPLALEERNLLDLVALGTVSDLAPLLGENRWLVQRGLGELNQSRRPGVQAMLAEAGIRPGRVDTTAIGFVLGPRLNAAGRLESADLSYQLLTAPDLETAIPLAARLGQLNRRRQELTLEMVARGREQIAPILPDRYLYFIAGPEFPPGVVGLVAGKLAEELYRPVFVAEQGPERTHGSGRSIPEFDITAALDECRELMERHGGHKAAAGFTVRNDNLPELRRLLEEIAWRHLAGRELVPALRVDAEAELATMDYAMVELLAQLEPFGVENPQPVFASYGLAVRDERVVGQDRQHLKLTVSDPGSSGPARSLVWDAVAFRQGEWSGRLPPRIDLAYSPEVNEFNGQRRLQLNVKDIRPAQG